MARNQQWQDDYWLPLMQLYLKKPVGVKPVYCKAMVDFAMEIHIAPQILFNKMCEIANLETPRIEHIWQEYGKNPRRLKRAVTLWHQMRGFGNEHFFEGWMSRRPLSVISVPSVLTAESPLSCWFLSSTNISG